jgi:lipopolysaccharide/colanic/teichoic acid biosynthesis glycosyltransferase
VKRLIDVAIAASVLAVAAPVMAATAAVVYADVGRPLLFRQDRVGLGGRIFELVKFRTMKDAIGRDGRPLPDGERLTRIGRFLRASSLDELPQLVNVLRGEMSLVGPRPERPEIVRLLVHDIPFYRTRLIVRPGLTGWAQVNHPYGDSVEDAVQKLEYDLYYLKHRSMLFDLRILLRTAGTVLRLGGR